jgi:GTP-dependent phosphoenolpyruvate carboxykinase
LTPHTLTIPWGIPCYHSNWMEFYSDASEEIPKIFILNYIKGQDDCLC